MVNAPQLKSEYERALTKANKLEKKYVTANNVLSAIRKEHRNFVRNVYKKVNGKKKILKDKELTLKKFRASLMKKEDELNRILKQSSKKKEEKLAALEKEKGKFKRFQELAKEKKKNYNELVYEYETRVDNLREEYGILNAKEFKLTQEKKKIKSLIDKKSKVLDSIESKTKKLNSISKKLKKEQERIQKRKEKVVVKELRIKEKERESKKKEKSVKTEITKSKNIKDYWEKRAKKVKRLEKDLNAVIRQRQLRGELNAYRKKNK